MSVIMMSVGQMFFDQKAWNLFYVGWKNGRQMKEWSTDEKMVDGWTGAESLFQIFVRLFFFFCFNAIFSDGLKRFQAISGVDLETNLGPVL